jgi:hypothetical protein
VYQDGIGTGLTNVCVNYDGTSAPSGIHMYFNGVAQSPTTLGNSLTSSAISGNPVTIGAGAVGVIGNVNVFANNTTSCANIYAQGPNKVY